MPAVNPRTAARPPASAGVFAGWALVLLLVLEAPRAQVQAGEPPAKLALCAGCHGRTGNSVEGQYPVLAGQRAEYIVRELVAFRDHRRNHREMSAIAALLEPDEIDSLAQWFESQPRWPTGFQVDATLDARGRRRAEELGCGSCHQRDYRGVGTVPALAGQHAEYLAAQLVAFKRGERSNDGGVMGAIVPAISDDDIRVISHHLAGMTAPE